ncbi:PAS domain-containing sensor histidine kinase [Conexibacter woesei]|uniref:histidine kinase n=1 Tax=Conexibacter woesei (strain DSM 14684 / CCUG 47730 / CIP 108061 / JCM 11494 / NBRC 100937 / ID131577) TaxID=469383 RepID=D3F701_CONWI|nr:PAS domain-containing sensor histidine kinase [Conexibacter woesei]ADB52799.1 PAS/PAC sensor hybrid histidine kinase [Conexibacter woesei DSM 14684]
MLPSLERSLVDSLPALVFVKDLAGRYLLLNRAARQMFGSCAGMVDADVFRRDQVRLLSAQDEHVAMREQPFQFHHELWFRERRLDYLTIKFPLLADDGELYAIGGFATDVSLLRRAEDEALEAWRAAERASDTKSHLIAQVSHELRAPLQSILGYSQLLKSLTHDSDEVRISESIANAGEHLLSLANDLLDTMRPGAPASSVSGDAIDPCQLVNEVIEMIRPLAAQRMVSLGRDVHAGLGLYVRGDRRRLKQVLINLMSNAVRYGVAHGDVIVRLERVPGSRLRFVVVNDGASIRPEHAERLFAPFDRLGQNVSAEGSGLGLALSRSFMEAMDGTIGIQESSAAGTAFYLELPIAAGASADPFAPAREAPLRVREDVRGRVLHVEDSAEQAQLMRDALARLLPNVELLHEASGRAALLRARTSDVDLLLVDMHLPDLSGEELLAGLAGLDVIVLSGLVTTEGVARARALGAIDYLAKPVDLARLQRAIVASLGSVTAL